MQGNRSHLAFGGGPHECPGQDVGRAIADTGVDALLMRLPDIRLDCDEDELRWTGSIASRHLVELPVRFEPRPPQEETQRPGWLITTPRPETTGPAPEPAAAPPVSPHPAAGPSPADPAGERSRPGLWQRVLRWWRGD
jgi:hypothetical protein